MTHRPPVQPAEARGLISGMVPGLAPGAVPLRAATVLALAVGLGALAGCGGDKGGSSQPLAGDATALATPSHENHLLGEDRSAAANGTDEAGAGVNAYLWRGAIDTLSFMPFASAEPEGGIIITDWYSPPTTSGERFKANAYVLGRLLRSDAIRVSIFRQVLQGGQWVDAPVASNTAADITAKILTRARQLRADAGAG